MSEYTGTCIGSLTRTLNDCRPSLATDVIVLNKRMLAMFLHAFQTVDIVFEEVPNYEAPDKLDRQRGAEEQWRYSRVFFFNEAVHEHTVTYPYMGDAYPAVIVNDGTVDPVYAKLYLSDFINYSDEIFTPYFRTFSRDIGTGLFRLGTGV